MKIKGAEGTYFVNVDFFSGVFSGQSFFSWD